jgi:hypothetical protein
MKSRLSRILRFLAGKEGIGPQTPAPTRPYRRAPTLEPLEERTLLTTNISFANHVLSINVGADSETASLRSFVNRLGSGDPAAFTSTALSMRPGSSYRCRRWPTA